MGVWLIELLSGGLPIWAHPWLAALLQLRSLPVPAVRERAQGLLLPAPCGLQQEGFATIPLLGTFLSSLYSKRREGKEFLKASVGISLWLQI